MRCDEQNFFYDTYWLPHALGWSPVVLESVWVVFGVIFDWAVEPQVQVPVQLQVSEHWQLVSFPCVDILMYEKKYIYIFKYFFSLKKKEKRNVSLFIIESSPFTPPRV